MSTPSAVHHNTSCNNQVDNDAPDPGCPTTGTKIYGYTAKTGYDCATGLGSLDANKFVSALATLVPTTTAVSAMPAMTSEGGSVVLDATVDVTGTGTQAIGGTVTFTFRSYLANGDVDLSWTLGEAAVTGGTTTSGAATLTTTIPPGMIQPSQSVDVFATYGGDAHYLPSHSAKQPITFAPIALCINPATKSVAAGGTISFAALGGVAPVRWYEDFDSTCDTTGMNCSTLDTTTGAFTAGTGADGYVIIVAVDADGAETFSEITVGGGSGTAPWTSGPSEYTGIVVSQSPATTCTGGQNCEIGRASCRERV